MDTLTQYQNLLENILKKYTEIPYSGSQIDEVQ